MTLFTPTAFDLFDLWICSEYLEQKMTAPFNHGWQITKKKERSKLLSIHIPHLLTIKHKTSSYMTPNQI